ncbi:hypothetical protein HDV04_004404 [Boothiomyces sp. JEL0838]|nr:hypothetical protein HDV04_004404 [Boothiomyces sp. JEL0838]
MVSSNGIKNWSGNTILITGGGSGIGLAFAKRMLNDGNRVILVGRRKQLLEHVKCENKGFEIIVGDVATEESRIQLAKTVIELYPDVNIIINNAGIQREIKMEKESQTPWKTTQSEVDINLCGPIHLSMLFMDHLMKKPNAAIGFVTSGLAFVPHVKFPIYAATKSALHSYCWSLREQLKPFNIKVLEIAPPAIHTDLNPELAKIGMDLQVFCDSVYARLKNGEEEVGYGFSQNGIDSFKQSYLGPFQSLNKNIHD